MADRRSLLRKPIIVGVVNVTPDSFSDGGNFLSPDAALVRVGQLLEEGADVVELGGESTRPGAQAVRAADEIARVVPVIAAAHERWPHATLAIDTVKAPVAAAALDAGASVVNDVSALRLDPELACVCAAAGCTLILMHSRGSVSDMASFEHARYAGDDVMAAALTELTDAVRRATAAGVRPDHVVLDPGIGFAKRGEHSVRALAQLPRLVDLGFPVMVGASRKRFLGEITGVKQPSERDAATLGAHVVALTLGATWFRVHDVRAHRHALDVAAAVLEARG